MLRPANDNLSILPRSVSVSTEKLKKRLLDEGINEGLVKDCEQIMLSEFSEIQGQLQFLSEERSNLLDTLQQLEVNDVNTCIFLPPSPLYNPSLCLKHPLYYFCVKCFIVNTFPSNLTYLCLNAQSLFMD